MTVSNFSSQHEPAVRNFFLWCMKPVFLLELEWYWIFAADANIDFKEYKHSDNSMSASD